MKRPIRRVAWLSLALAGLALAGPTACGFTPMYGDGVAGTSLSRIAVTTQDDRLGYRVRERLEDALGRDATAQPQWRLATTIEQSRRPLGRRVDDTATRYELVVIGRWTLTPSGAGLPMSGIETVTTTYAAADQPYAAIAAQQDGEDRAAAELARQIRLALLSALARPPVTP